MFPSPCRCRHGTRARITLGRLGGTFSAFEYNDLVDVGAERILGQINVWEIYVMNAELDFNSCVREHFIHFVRFNELVVFVYGKGDRSVRGFDEVESVTERGVDYQASSEFHHQWFQRRKQESRFTFNRITERHVKRET
jgi:hypothetical protein